MSKQTQSSRRSHMRSPHLSIAPSELRRLRTRLHAGEHVVLNPQDVTTVLDIVDLIAPVESAAPAVRQPKPPYQRQQHRHLRRNRT